MAFKGTWHRAEAGGNSSAGGDRRYQSSNENYSSYSLPPQGVPNNQMSLPPMNYQNNPNPMYSVMNSGPSMVNQSNYSSASKTLPYKGTVSNIYRDFGVIDNEISFKLNAVSGPLPRVGDRVVCQIKPAEGFGNQSPYKYFGFEVRSMQNQTETRRPPPRPSTSQTMSRNSDSYTNRTNNRNPPSTMKRSLPTNNNQQASFGSNQRDRQLSIDKNGNNDRHRVSPPRRSDSRTNKTLPPKRTSRPPINKYSCTLPKGNLDNSEFNVIQVRTRYSRLHIPSDFYHLSYTWHQTIPLDRPLKFLTPCSFHIFNKNVPRLLSKHESVLDPPDVDYTWNVRVMLMSSPDIQTLISRSCLLNNDPTKKPSINVDDFDHPSKLIKFLVGVRHQNEYFPLGGCWSESLDGPNPASDPQVLIRTAIRCVHAQTSIDLSKCLQWCRYLEVRYHRPEEIHKGRLIESRIENIVVFLPDLGSTCMPSSLEWEEIHSIYKQACDEELAEELNEAILSDEHLEERSASHHATIDVENLRVIDLKIELKARGQPVTGLKVDLKKRLTKILEQEKADEEKTDEANAEQSNGTAGDKTEVKEPLPAEIEKLRKEIQSKYQLPSQRAILVHPTSLKGDKFDCRVVSLHYLLNYANKDTIKEKCFELYLFSEAFNEMLMRDYSYQIYRSLYSCLEVTETNVQNPPSEPKANDEEHQEPMNTEGEDVVSPPLDSSANDEHDPEENGKKRKRSPSKDETSTIQRKKSALDEEKISSRPRTIHPELLLAFTYFDRNHCGYIIEKDLEEILLLSGLSLTKNEVKVFVTRIAQDEKIRYHRLTDKVLPTEETENSNPLDRIELEIDSTAPKGNLLSLPSHLSVFGIRSTINADNPSLNISIDHQRAMKQLEMSNRIQTNLELKIDALKKEIQHLTDELHSSQKSSRSYSDQLSETKKRLRDTQHDLKELEEKYKRYSDALYRVRNESRSTVEHLNHVLGIKEKVTSSQPRKSEDETKKTSTTIKTESEKKKENETPQEQEPEQMTTNQVEEKDEATTVETTVNDQDMQ